jgi:hypothetical protein
MTRVANMPQVPALGQHPARMRRKRTYWKKHID